MTLPELLQKIEELSEKATKGPWRTERQVVSHCIDDGYGDGGYPNRSTFLIRGRHSDQIHSGESRFTRAGNAPDVAHDSDAVLMALARTAMPLLAQSLKMALELVRECADNFDCENDAHAYGTYCRSCEAAKLRSRIQSLIAEGMKGAG